jgi:hypothetical protein
MKRKCTIRIPALGLVLVILSAPAAAGSQDAYVIPRLVAGDIQGFIYTSNLSFRNLSNKQCEGRFHEGCQVF